MLLFLDEFKNGQAAFKKFIRSNSQSSSSSDNYSKYFFLCILILAHLCYCSNKLLTSFSGAAAKDDERELIFLRK